MQVQLLCPSDRSDGPPPPPPCPLQQIPRGCRALGLGCRCTSTCQRPTAAAPGPGGQQETPGTGGRVEAGLPRSLLSTCSRS